jgi:hypothetical protein
MAGQARIQSVINYNNNVRKLKDQAKAEKDDEIRQATAFADAATSGQKYKSLMTSGHVANATTNLRKLVKYKGYLEPVSKAANVEEAGAELANVGSRIGAEASGTVARLTSEAAPRTAAALGEVTGGIATRLGARSGSVIADSVGHAGRAIMSRSSAGLGAERAASSVIEAGGRAVSGGVGKAIASGAGKAAVSAAESGGKIALKGGLKTLGKAAGVAGAGVNIVSAGESLMKDFTAKDGFQLGGSKDANSWTKRGDAEGLVSGAADVAGLGLLMAATGPVGLGAAAIFAGIGAITGIASAIETGIGAEKEAEKETEQAQKTHEDQIEDIGEQHSVPTKIQKSVTARAEA